MSKVSRAHPADMDKASRACRAELNAVFRAQIVVGHCLAEELGMEGGASKASRAHPVGMEGRVSKVSGAHPAGMEGRARKRGWPVGSKNSKNKKAHRGDIYLHLLADMEGRASEASGARPAEADAVLVVDRFLAEEHYAL